MISHRGCAAHLKTSQRKCCNYDRRDEDLRRADYLALIECQQCPKYPGLAKEVPRKPFANHVYRFDRLNQPSRVWAAWPLHRSQASFNGSMIRFDPVVGVASRSLAARPLHPTFTLQLPNRRGITAQPVPRNHAGWTIVGIRPTPSSKSIWRLPDRAFRKGRSRPSALGCRPPGTGTATGRRCEQTSHPCAKWTISASPDPAAADAPPVRTAAPNARS